MERGNLTGASDAVLDGVANALQLDEAERAHLLDLARAAQPASPRQRRTKASGVTDGIQQILDAITDAGGRATPGTTCSPPTARPRPLRSGPRRPRRPANNAVSSTSTRQRATFCGLGACGRRHCRHAPLRGWQQSPRPAAHRADRRAINPQSRTSAPDGPPTTSAFTEPATSAYSTLWSVPSTSISRPWSSPRTPVSHCSLTPRQRTPPLPIASGCSPAGPPPPSKPGICPPAYRALRQRGEGHAILTRLSAGRSSARSR